jgi:hypothetical protein
MRSYPALERALAAAGQTQWAERTADAIKKEQARIEHAMSFLEPICAALGDAGVVVVIKSLDHWPDLGNDLDLYSDAAPDDVIAIMSERFDANMVERSWGDRLANKRNFAVPGLPELVEVHIGRLGQTGEQRMVANSLTARAQSAQFGSQVFRVPASEDRTIISTLQRMYRHFYIRLCDIADNARLMDAGAVDYVYLRALAEESGLWAGIATYLNVISDYVKQYRGEGISLPTFVRSAARFGGDQIYFRKNFLRVPIVPHSASLYAAELMKLLVNGEIANTLRLSLLPALATAAALELKLTGSDKGIW